MDKLTFTPTSRGFLKAEFIDSYGDQCSLQESSNAHQAHIWFGPDTKYPKALISGHGWTDIKKCKVEVAGIEHEIDFDDHNTLISSRMHLTQEQVKALLPALKHFVKHGTLPEA